MSIFSYNQNNLSHSAKLCFIEIFYLQALGFMKLHNGSSNQSFMVDTLRYFSFQPVLHDWYNKGCGMCCPVCGIMHLKEPLLLIGMSSPCGRSRFPLSLSEWPFTICMTPYNRKIKCVECVVK